MSSDLLWADEMPGELAMLTLLPKMIAGTEEETDRMDKRQWAGLLAVISSLGDAGTLTVAQEQKLLSMCSAGDARIVRLFKSHANSNRKRFVEGCKELAGTAALTPTEWPSRISRSRSNPTDTNLNSQVNRRPLASKKVKPGSQNVRLASSVVAESFGMPFKKCGDGATHRISLSPPTSEELRASPTAIFSPMRADCDADVITSADVVYLEV
jgi:hypothetical protein